MKNRKRHTDVVHIATVLTTLTAMLLQACAAPVGPDNSVDEPATLADFSTGQLMQGLVLGDGPVAEHIPTIRDNLMVELRLHDEDSLEEYHAMAAWVVDEVLRDNPEFGHQFRADVLSGEHMRIQLAMHDAALLVQEVYEAQPEFPETGSDLEGRGLCGVFALAAAVVVVVVAFNAAAVVLNVAAAANLFAAVAVQRTIGVGQSSVNLLAEQIVADVASAR